MTCTTMTMMHICTNPHGRLKVGNRYVWVDYHRHCGPEFSWDAAGNKPYEPKGEHDPIWEVFLTWLEKRDAKEHQSNAEVKGDNK